MANFGSRSKGNGASKSRSSRGGSSSANNSTGGGGASTRGRAQQHFASSSKKLQLQQRCSAEVKSTPTTKKRRKKKVGRPPSTPNTAKTSNGLSSDVAVHTPQHSLSMLQSPSNRGSSRVSEGKFGSPKVTMLSSSSSSSQLGSVPTPNNAKEAPLNRNSFWPEMERRYFRPVEDSDLQSLKALTSMHAPIPPQSSPPPSASAKKRKASSKITRKKRERPSPLSGSASSQNSQTAALHQRLVACTSNIRRHAAKIRSRVKSGDKAAVVQEERRCEALELKEFAAINAWTQLQRKLFKGVRDLGQSESAAILAKSKTPPAAAAGGGSTKELGACSVCFEVGDESTMINQMFSCARCGVFVHKNCYGVGITRNSREV
eukprot:jgi/Bigna1/127541/aug1.4_g2249